MGVWLEADDQYRSFGHGGDDEDACCGAVGGREEPQVRRDAGQELPRGAGTDQARRMPPRSRVRAKLRSTSSPRSLNPALATPDRSRVRLL